MTLLIVQTAVLMLMAFAVVAAGGSLAATSALAAGTGPAALGAAMYIVMIFVAALAGFIAIVVPLSLVSGSTLLFALSAGYRYMRWTRFLGVAANLAGLAYVFAAYLLYQELSLLVLSPILLLSTSNIVMLLLLPCRPHVDANRKLAYSAIPLMYALLPAILLVALYRSPPRFDTGGYVFLAVLFVLYSLPFHYIFRTIPATKSLDKRLAWRLAIAVGISVLALFVLFPMGLFLCLSTIMLLLLAEMTLLFPRTPPPAGSLHARAAKLLGRLPSAPSPEKNEYTTTLFSERNETDASQETPEPREGAQTADHNH